MFDQIPIAPPDPILGLMEAFKVDPNPAKINLSVGVYQNEQGCTPVLECVRRAEQRLLEEGATKAYLGIDGLPDYVAHVRRLVFGEQVPVNRVATAQTPGGTGALRVAADFLRNIDGGARVWLSQPTWVNHANIFESARLVVEYYPYLDASGRGLDLDGMLDTLEQASAGDVVCLHACCHNPTGFDPSTDQWSRIAEVLKRRELIPVVDFAYQGFGDGLEEDRAGLRQLIDAGLELVVCSSYSKNFGLYGERVGAISALSATPLGAVAALSQIKAAIRANYSSPPRHGAALVTCVLGDRELSSLWEHEVATMRERIHAMRKLFVEKLTERALPTDFSFLLSQRGMFSYSGLNRMQVDELRSRHAIYIVGNGRINVAGMASATMDRLCDAIAEVVASRVAVP